MSTTKVTSDNISSSVSEVPATSGFVLTADGSGSTSWGTNGSSPIGPAGGDLSGTYPNPTVTTALISGSTSALADNVSSVNVAAAAPPSTGQVLTATDSTHATWQTPISPTSVITVAPSGGQYTTLAAAIAAVGSPSSRVTISIAPGTYTETPVTIPDFVDIVSAGIVQLNYSNASPGWTIAAGANTHVFRQITVLNAAGPAILVSGNLVANNIVTPSGTSLNTSNAVAFIECTGVGSPALHISGTRQVTVARGACVGTGDRAITSDTSATVSVIGTFLENFGFGANKDVVYLGATSSPYLSTFTENFIRTPNGGFAINAPSSVTVILAENGLHHITNDTAAAPGYGTNIVPAPASAAHLIINTSQLRFTDGNQASGKLLTSDASGNASWQFAAADSTGAIQFNASGAFAGDAAKLFWDNSGFRLAVARSLGAVDGPYSLEVQDALTVVGDSGALLRSVSYGGAAPAFSGYGANGTESAPEATGNGDSILFLGAKGHDGSSFTTAGSRAVMFFNAVEDWTPTAQGTEIKWRVTPTGTTTNLFGMRLSSIGDLFLTSAASSDCFLHLESPGRKWRLLSESSSGKFKLVDQNSTFVPLTIDTGVPTDAFHITSTGIGIGTATPAANLDVTKDGDTSAIFATSFGTSIGGGVVGRRSRGSKASPTAVLANNKLAFFTGLGHDGTSFASDGRAGMRIHAGENYTPSDQGTFIQWFTTPLGQVAEQISMTLSTEGLLGIGTDTPAFSLDVASDINAGGVYRVAGAQISSSDLSNDASLIKTSTTLGGDLSGNLPNPSVAKLGTTGASVVVNTASPPTTGQVLTATSATIATWQTSDFHPASGSNGAYIDLDSTSASGREFTITSTGSGDSLGANKLVFRDETGGVNAAVLTSTGLGLGTTTPSEKLDVGGNIKTTGYITSDGIKVTGTTRGTDTLVGGTVTVTNSNVTASSIILLTTQSPSGTPGAVYISARTPGTDFTITSTSGTDTSLVGWLIIEPI